MSARIALAILMAGLLTVACSDSADRGLGAGSSERAGDEHELESSDDTRALANRTQGRVPESLTLATGTEGGVYDTLGVGIGQAITHLYPEIAVTCLQTPGSIRNARMLDEGRVDLALIQSDIAAYFTRGERMFCLPLDSIKGLASLYPEALHLVTLHGSTVTSIDSLKGRSVAVGPKGSGSEFIARSVLEVAGIADDLAEVINGSFKQACDSLQHGKVDAIFVTSGVPSPAVTALDTLNAPDTTISFVRLDEELLNKLQRELRELRITTIPGSAYVGLTEDIQTIGPVALLVATNSLSDNLAQRVTRAIFSGDTTLLSVHEVAKQIDVNRAQLGMSVELHRGAEAFYEGRDAPVSHLERYISGAVVAVAVALTAFLILRKRLRLRNRALRQTLTVVVSLAAVFAGLTVTMYWCERQENYDFVDLPRAVWSTARYALGGMGIGEPVTKSGKVCAAALLFIVRFGVLATVVGGVVALFMEGRMRPPRGTRGHDVVCGWDKRVERIIKELRDLTAGGWRAVVIVADHVSQKARDDLCERRDDVYFVERSPTDECALKEAYAHRARSVIVLADEELKAKDERTAVVVSEIRRWCENAGGGTVRPNIIAEAVTPVGKRLIENAGDHQVDVVCPVDYGLGLLAQCAVHRKISSVYNDLLRWSDDTNEIYKIPWDDIPDDLRNARFEDASCTLSGRRNSENPVVLLGVIRGEDVILNPRTAGRKLTEAESSFGRIQEGDALIVLAFHKPDLKEQLKAWSRGGHSGPASARK